MKKGRGKGKEDGSVALWEKGKKKKKRRKKKKKKTHTKKKPTKTPNWRTNKKTKGTTTH